MPTPTTPTPPGWYPDPWYPQAVRWWDGATWTAYAQGVPQTGGTAKLSEIRGWAKRAPIAFWAEAASVAISSVASPLVTGRMWHDVLDAMEDERRTHIDTGFTGGSIVLQLLGLVSVAALIVLAVWGHHITSTARALGLRTTQSPGWGAAGWLVPIVNFWFPFQIVRDALPPEDPARRQVPLWWGLHITAGVASLVGLITALFSTGAGALVGGIGAAAALGSGYYGHELALAIGKAHEQLAERSGAAVGAPL